MNPEQVALIQDSFEKVQILGEAVADMFYGRLFEIAPEVRPLFPQDIKPQGRKLLTMLATVVNSLDNLASIVPAVQDLGRRHAGYQAQPEHYDAVGQALLWTLSRGLGDDFTPDVEEAWTEAYTILSTTMIEAAENRSAA